MAQTDGVDDGSGLEAVLVTREAVLKNIEDELNSLKSQYQQKIDDVDLAIKQKKEILKTFNEGPNARKGILQHHLLATLHFKESRLERLTLQEKEKKDYYIHKMEDTDGFISKQKDSNLQMESSLGMILESKEHRLKRLKEEGIKHIVFDIGLRNYAREAASSTRADAADLHQSSYPLSSIRIVEIWVPASSLPGSTFPDLAATPNTFYEIGTSSPPCFPPMWAYFPVLLSSHLTAEDQIALTT
jgi:hypothetical protein